MKYIAYGSNMSMEQMAFRCPDAHVVGVGYLEGWKLEFYLHATVEPVKRDGRVPVVVWEISESDELNLDHYEGVPSYYTKERATATLMDGEKVEGLIYLMRKYRDLPPTSGYVKGIADAYRRFGFKKELADLNEAVRVSEIASWRYKSDVGDM